MADVSRKASVASRARARARARPAAQVALRPMRSHSEEL
jgi:hypothetical protein